MPRTHSKLAKRGFRITMTLRMNIISARITEIDKEIRLYQSFLKHKGLNTRWVRRVLVVLRRKKRIRTRQLNRYTARWNNYKRRGLI